jgi:peroxiredoxin Q/BCP
MIAIGDPAPEIQLEADDLSQFKLSDRRGQRTLLVFYPGDETPVCTAQLCEYRDGFDDYRELGVDVVGISKDSIASHQDFKRKRFLPFTLLSDPKLVAAKAYGSSGILGMKRSVFLVDEEGVIRYAHIEALALFKRSHEELIEAIRALGAPKKKPKKRS